MEINENALQFELYEHERQMLLELTRMPGYRVLQRVRESYIRALVEGATGISLNDPLNDREKVANAWAYAKIGRTVASALDAGVQFEIEVLRMATEAKDPKTLAKLRRERFILEAVPSEVRRGI